MNEHRSTIEPFSDEPLGSDELLGELDGEPPEPEMQVSVANEQSTLSIDESQLRATVLAVFQNSPYHSGSVSIAVVDDPTIHGINRQYLQHDYPTDVLSFVLEDREPYLEGELVVSTDTALRSAEDYDWNAQSELLLYVIHGALHLVGYRDKQPNEIADMRAAELRLLQELGVNVPSDSSRWSNKEETERSLREVPRT